jgi:hypothetical protein
MNNGNGAVEPLNEGDAQASIARCQEFVERVCLNALSDCATMGLVVSKAVLADSVFAAFQSWARSPASERILGMPAAVSSVFLAAHESRFRATFAPAIDSAYASWERANSVNGAIAN